MRLEKQPEIPHGARMPFRSVAQRKYLFAKHPDIAARFAAETPKGAKLPDHANSMDAPTLADKMSRAKFSRNARVIPRKEKLHPVMKQAQDAFHRLHAGKFAMNAGRGFAKKK